MAEKVEFDVVVDAQTAAAWARRDAERVAEEARIRVERRDRLAMAALPVVGGGIIHMDGRDRREIARAAYALADEMLEASGIDPSQLKNLVR